MKNRKAFSAAAMASEYCLSAPELPLTASASASSRSASARASVRSAEEWRPRENNPVQA